MFSGEGKLRLLSKFNPIWKMVAVRLAAECRRCGQPRLCSVFAAFVAAEKPGC